MATEAGYPESNYPGSNLNQNLTNLRQRTQSNKRKRGIQDDLHAGIRGSATSRRAASNIFAQQHDGSSGAATASMADSHGDNYFNQPAQDLGNDDSNAPQFDLSALQAQNQSTNAHGSNVGTNANVDTAAAALSQHYSMQVPPHPADSFANEPTIGGEQPFGNMDDAHEYGGPEGDISSASLGIDTPGKPAVGTEEWNKQRKDNHKEVERRRRETINEGINELAKIVPGCEKNKGSILARAVQYITRLHDEASQSIDKWTFEKLVTEQAIAELGTKFHRAYSEKEAWKRVARHAGVDVDHVDLGLENAPDGQGNDKDAQAQKDGEGESQDADDGREIKVAL